MTESSIVISAVRDCPVCQGQRKVRGIFHLIDCVNCNALGFVETRTGHIVEPEQAVCVLQGRLRDAHAEIEQLTKRLDRVAKYEQKAIRDEQLDRIYPKEAVKARRGTRSTGHGD